MGVEGIILAAGLSSRAPGYKMTLPFNNKTVIECTIDSMLGFCKRLIVGGGYRIKDLEAVIKGYSNVELVYNEDYLQGMYSSIKKGMSLIKEDSFFFTPGDYPMIAYEVYEELLKYTAPVVIPTFEGRKGHPLLLQSTIINEVLHATKHKTLRDVIREKDTVLVPVNCRGILQDLDTLQDYEALKAACVKG